MMGETKISLSITLAADGLTIEARNHEDSSKRLFAHIASV